MRVLSTIILFLSFFSVSSYSTSSAPPLFIFGDSVVDCGNNDYLFDSSAVADYLPYGIDFYAVTGRFSNARNIADVIGQLLGIGHFIPCARDPNTTGEWILDGVNYASAGTGILPNSTGDGADTPLPYQIDYFEEKTLPELEAQLGRNQLSSYLADAIFLFNSGGNDIVNDCSSATCNISDFTDFLIGYYNQLLKRVYSLGGRKFLLLSPEVGGCTPIVRRDNDGACNEGYNIAYRYFNSHLNSSIDRFTEELQDSHFVFADLYNILYPVLEDPTAYGFTVANFSCCEMGTGSSCIENGPVCEDRNTYVYFDGGHPTDAANVILANEVYSSNKTSLTYPFNAKTLASINPTPLGHSLAQQQIMGTTTGKDVE